MVKNTQSKALLHRTNKGAPSFGSARNTYKVKQKQNFFHYFLPLAYFFHYALGLLLTK